MADAAICSVSRIPFDAPARKFRNGGDHGGDCGHAVLVHDRETRVRVAKTYLGFRASQDCALGSAFRL